MGGNDLCSAGLMYATVGEGFVLLGMVWTLLGRKGQKAQWPQMFFSCLFLFSLRSYPPQHSVSFCAFISKNFVGHRIGEPPLPPLFICYQGMVHVECFWGWHSSVTWTSSRSVSVMECVEHRLRLGLLHHINVWEDRVGSIRKKSYPARCLAL